MPIVRARDHESPEMLSRRFKRACEKAGVMTELRRREYHEKPTSKRKREAAAARKRHLKRLAREMPQRNDYRDQRERD